MPVSKFTMMILGNSDGVKVGAVYGTADSGFFIFVDGDTAPYSPIWKIPTKCLPTMRILSV